MDPQEFLDALRDDHRTAISRLGSSKAVYALTGGEMEGDAVRAAAAREVHAASELFGAWADEAEGEAAALYADLADDADGHYETIAPDEHPEDGALAAELADYDDPVERLGATVGYLLVVGKWAEQFVGFFVGDADPTTADEFRGIRSDLEDGRDRAAGLLAESCEAEADRDLARTAADEVVDAAYDDYVTTLESMGIEPKNVC